MNDETLENAPTCSGQCARATRRTVLQTLTALVLGGALWPLRALGAKKVAIGLDKVPALKKVGGSALLDVKGRQVLFIRDSASSIRALHPVCTHKKSLVKYDARAKIIRCPEHGSRYSLEGKVLKGPSTKPLSPVYSAQLDLAKNRIIVAL